MEGKKKETETFVIGTDIYIGYNPLGDLRFSCDCPKEDSRDKICLNCMRKVINTLTHIGFAERKEVKS